MGDIEPYGGSEFYHKDNGCPNAGRSYNWEPPHDGAGRVHGLVQLVPKKVARARTRGAKSARKYRKGKS